MLRFVSLENKEKMAATIKIIGVGGSGCNIIENMISNGIRDVEFIAINTDAQTLEMSNAKHRIQIGKNITRGLGAGADPNIGRKAAEESKEEILEIVENSDLVFIVSGLGGGTGSGASPIIASLAKSCGALVIGIVTIPFKWEGKRRLANATGAKNELENSVDSLIVFDNNKMLNIMDSSTPASAAFDKSNAEIYNTTKNIIESKILEATKGIADLITVPGIINVDFADVRSVMNKGGEVIMGSGKASGKTRAIEAAKKALSSLMPNDVSIKRATNILLNVTGSSDLTMQEIEEGNNVIFEATGAEANIIFGFVKNEGMDKDVSYTIIASGFTPIEKLGSINSLEVEEVTKRAKGKMFSGANDDDLAIPTIHRIKIDTKRVAENLKTEIQGKKSDSEEKIYKSFDDDIDSASFLRKIMD